MIVELFQGYAIKKRVRGQKWPVYLQYIHGDKIAWTLDYTSARIYKNKSTAQKHDKNISETLTF